MKKDNLIFTNVNWFNGQRFVYGQVSTCNGLIKDDNQVENSNSGTIIDCKEKFLLPSFTEAHMHFLSFAKSLLHINASTATTREEITSLTKAQLKKNDVITRNSSFAVTNSGSDKWIVLSSFKANFFADNPLTMKFLDSIVQDFPLAVISFDLHSAIFNSQARKSLTDNKIVSCSEFTGDHLFEEPAFKATAWINDSQGSNPEMLVKSTVEKLNSLGITAIQSFDGVKEYNLIKPFADKNFFNLNFIGSLREEDLSDYDTSNPLTLKSNSNSSLLKQGPLKLFCDGALGSQTAFMSSPYLNNTENYGIELIDVKKLTELILAADAVNLPVAVHGIGDRAIDNILTAFSSLSSLRNKEIGNRIEHCQYIRNDQLAKLKKSGLSITTLGRHLPYDLEPSIKLLGPDRTKWLHRLKDFHDEGILYALTSDAPVANVNPIENLYWACDGRNLLYKPHNKIRGKALSRLQALTALTKSPAELINTISQSRWGSIKPGMSADMVLLSGNPLTEKNVLNLKVLKTIFKGKIVYELTCRNLYK